MQPSGLIFLVIIAIWAAYLLQHWVRRREHLATARSVDRFSDAMRVLERRTPLPESDLSPPQPRSYSVSPARPSRSEVVVKRAQSPTPTTQMTPAPAVRSTRVFHAMGRMSARRLRGLSLLASLSLVVVVSALSAFAVLPWWSVLVGVAVLAGDLAWLRHAAVVDRSARRGDARIRSAGASSGIPTGGAATESTTAAPAKRTAARPAALDEAVVAGADEAGRTVGLTASESDAVVDSAVEVDLSGWAPVPVPPPTYTLKAKAERPEPVHSAAEQTPTADPSSTFGGLVDEGELDGLLNRRRAAGA